MILNLRTVSSIEYKPKKTLKQGKSKQLNINNLGTNENVFADKWKR